MDEAIGVVISWVNLFYQLNVNTYLDENQKRSDSVRETVRAACSSPSLKNDFSILDPFIEEVQHEEAWSLFREGIV